MDTLLRTPYRTFSEGYYALPIGKVKDVKYRLMSELGWSISTFHYKRRGETPIKEAEQLFIEELFAEYGIDAWTGKNL